MSQQEVSLRAIPEQRGLAMREKVAGPPGIQEFLGDGFAALSMAGVPLSGPPFVIYHDPGFSAEAIDTELVCPVAPGKGPVTTPAGRTMAARTVPGGEAAVIIHVGPYETVGEAYRALAGWIGEHGYRVSGPPQEVYLSSPADPGLPVTEVRFPVEKIPMEQAPMEQSSPGES